MKKATLKTSQKKAGNSEQFIAIAPCLQVHDVNKTTQYYVKYLNFKRIYQSKDFAHVQRDGVHIEFRKSDRFRVDSCCEYNERRNLEIMVRDLDQLYNEFDLQGVHIIWGPEEQENGKRKLEIEDCNGYVLMFTEPRRL